MNYAAKLLRIHMVQVRKTVANACSCLYAVLACFVECFFRRH